MAEVKFAPHWLYGPGGQSVLCEEQAHYDAVLAQGWQDSPAKFGMETHPSHPVQMMPGMASEMVSVPTEPSQEMMDLMNMLQAGMDDLRSLVATLDARLAALETPHAPEPPQSSGRKGS